METNQKALRRKVLQMLYAARAKDPESGHVFGREFRDALGECEFALAVLTEIGHVTRDGYQYRITGQGVIAFEDRKD